ncbi:hypothetical protein [Rhodoferax sp.]|uniref:hypothetical protein n=1 Tax=Rhodoferax sp. TaxID=50421 RepID=UPI0025F60C70|nr:hypothetical protein [Rhodoferax sp.]
MTESTPTLSGKQPSRSLVARIKGINKLFAATVLLPTALAVLYFGLIASDVYISESRFVVRSPQKQASAGIGALLQGAGFSRSADDTYSVHDYITSRDALKQLNASFGLTNIYGSPSVDIFSRFAPLGTDENFEALHHYYQKHINVEVDASSSISTLKAYAYTAADAHRINEKLLELSERLVNQLNERGRQDMIKFATAEVDIAEAKAKAATLAVSKFRGQKGVFDPERQSALQLQLVSKLQDELISTKTQLVQIRALTPDNPQIPSLQKRVDTLQSEINSETAKVAGDGGQSLSNTSADYERLSLERLFADKQLGAAMASLEQARNDAQRKQFYLERIVQASLPDVATEPRRVRSILATLLIGLITWSILTMLLAGVREHQD